MSLSRILPILMLLLVSWSAPGCGESETSTPTGTKVRLALNWKPEPQFGGFYDAQVRGAYAKHGLTVEILPGAAGTPTVQMIGAGSAEFGIVSADEIVLARDRGNDVVALFAVYQDCPQGLMTHADRGFDSIDDIFANDGIVAMQKALPYARLLEKQHGFGKVQVVPSPGGDITQFLANPKFTQQCFVTSEPLAANKKGVKTKTFLVKEAGYNPYTTVLATSRRYLESNPKEVAAMVGAVKEGWTQYLADPKQANDVMREERPDMDVETFTESADAQKPLILTAEAEEQGIGVMTTERWQALIDQLKSLGDVTKDIKAEECFHVVR
jgi:NitT/TauT family transport system substrate-binding protein